MTEAVLQIGSDRRVVAVVTAPDDQAIAKGVPPLGVILVNAGVIHRVGPHRINVKLARALAAEGIASVRLDLSGRGDSPAAKTQATLAEQAVLDIQSAMDALTRLHGCLRFAMFGICSGAVNAMDAATQDPRLVGVCLYDGYAFPTWKTRLVYYWLSVSQRSATLVFDSVVRNVAALVRRVGASKPPEVSTNKGIGTMPVETYQGFLDRMSARGTHVWIVFSGSVGDVYNHTRQFSDVFVTARLDGRVRCDYLPHLDHTLTSQASQRDWTQRLVGWARERAESGEVNAGHPTSAIAAGAPHQTHDVHAAYTAALRQT